jgi:hypothetical protein
MNRNKNNQCGFASDGSFAIPIGWMDKNWNNFLFKSDWCSLIANILI